MDAQPRTLRSSAMRAVLWYAADGKCQICGAKLPSNWHADHIEPWSVKPETNVHRMQALCPRCNLKKGARRVDLKKLRPGQQDAMRVILERVRACEETTTIVLPTRYGKSDLIRLTALEAKRDELCEGSIVLSPGLVLRNQIVSKERLADMALRYGLKVDAASNAQVSAPDTYDPFSNEEYLLSMTMEHATRAQDLMIQLVRHVGKVLVFIDECHQTSHAKPRGELVQRLRNCGAHLVLLTATPIRADGEYIPGFDAIELDRKASTYHRVTDAGDGIHNQVDLYAGTKVLRKLRADFEVTFAEAWQESPSPLCHLSRETFDAEFDSAGKLSDMSHAECRKFIAKATRDSRTMRLGIGLMLDDIQRRRRIHEESAAIIFTGNDLPSDKDDNAHANEIRKIIREEQERVGLSLDVKIATMKSDADEKAAATISQFCEHGKGDVLIVKQMGGAGLDVPRAKTLLDLSSVRTVASTIQRIMRVATPYNGVMTATVITLRDALSNAIWKTAVEDEGGAVGSWRGEYELVDSHLVPKSEETSEKDIDFLDSVTFGGFDDSFGNTGEPEQFAAVNELLNEFPELASRYTKAQVADRLTRCRLLSRQDSPATSVTADAQELYQRINDLTSRLASKKYRYVPGQTEWRDERKWLMNYAKEAVAVPLDIELREISSHKTLLKMIGVLEDRINGDEE